MHVSTENKIDGDLLVEHCAERTLKRFDPAAAPIVLPEHIAIRCMDRLSFRLELSIPEAYALMRKLQSVLPADAAQRVA